MRGKTVAEEASFSCARAAATGDLGVSWRAEQHGPTSEHRSCAIKKRSQLVQDVEGRHGAEFKLHTAERS